MGLNIKILRDQQGWCGRSSGVYPRRKWFGMRGDRLIYIYQRSVSARERMESVTSVRRSFGSSCLFNCYITPQRDHQSLQVQTGTNRLLPDEVPRCSVSITPSLPQRRICMHVYTETGSTKVSRDQWVHSFNKMFARKNKLKRSSHGYCPFPYVKRCSI